MISVRRHVLPTAGFVLATILVFVALLQGSIPTTRAAWTDRTVVTGTVTAASTWLPPFTGNKCLAYSSPTAAPTPCTITAIRFEGISATSGHFYIKTDAPGGSHHVDVDVDLRGATGLPATWTSWSQAGLLAGSHVIPAPGWTCASLPRLAGHAKDWHLTDFQVSVTLQRAGANTVCP